MSWKITSVGPGLFRATKGVSTLTFVYTDAVTGDDRARCTHNPQRLPERDIEEAKKALFADRAQEAKRKAAAS